MKGQEPSAARDELGLSLICRVQAHWCALPLRHVIETMRPMPTTPIPGAPIFVDGLAIIRGEPVPVVNMPRLMGAAVAQPTRLVCVRTDRGRIALAVDGVQGVRSITADSLQALPPVLDCADTQFITAIGMLDTQLLFVMQTARMVPEALWADSNAEAASA
ncbi:MAG: chemotaxis protein CheW [Steroidobacteraceae bacterium]